MKENQHEINIFTFKFYLNEASYTMYLIMFALGRAHLIHFNSSFSYFVDQTRITRAKHLCRNIFLIHYHGLILVTCCCITSYLCHILTLLNAYMIFLMTIKIYSILIKFLHHTCIPPNNYILSVNNTVIVLRFNENKYFAFVLL